MIPARSPHGLLQEDLWPDEWKCLVTCVMLNCTTRKQAQKILPIFFARWPSASDILKADPAEISLLISSLGFKNRRTERLIQLASAYEEKNWTHVRELPGIGEYASRMWEIFFLGRLGDEQPSDGALTLYWRWRRKLATSIEQPIALP